LRGSLKTIEGNFFEAWGTGGNPKPLPFDRPAIAFIGIEMNVGLIDVNQQTALMQRIIQVDFQLLQKSGSMVGVPFIQEFACFLPGKSQIFEDFTERVSTTVNGKGCLDPVHQSFKRPARQWVALTLLWWYRRDLKGLSDRLP